MARSDFRWLNVLFLSQFLIGPSSLSAQSIVDDSLFAPSLGRMKHYDVFLPAGYSDTSRYPLLVLLHGFTGDYRNWFQFTGLATYDSGLPLVIVTPDGENSWYVNSITVPAQNFEDYIVHDVLDNVKKNYRIDTGRIAIGGVSMGGYGALVLGLRHPTVFSVIAALSSSLDVPNGIPDLEKHGREGLRPSLEQALGAQPSSAWEEHDLSLLASKLDSAHAPYVYLSDGIQDEFKLRLQLHRAFADTLRARGLPYEYHETPGRHNWEYWDREIQGVLKRLEDLWHLHARASGVW